MYSKKVPGKQPAIEQSQQVVGAVSRILEQYALHRFVGYKIIFYKRCL
jgi:hypothetical protein